MKLVWESVVCVSILVLGSGVALSDDCPRPGPPSQSRIGHVGAGSSTNFYFNAAGTFVEADGSEGFLVLDLGSQGEVRFPLDAGFRMSADKRTRLHGIQDLDLTDLQRGDRVQVKFSSFDGRVVRLKLKKPNK
jgi:hypothetical protein